MFVEADGWHDVAALMDTVDRALDPHRRTVAGRRWSVTAARVPDEHRRELTAFLAGTDAAVDTAPDRLTA